jgi:hypothetical protein
MTGAQSVKHDEVLVPSARSAPADTTTSAEHGDYFGQRGVSGEISLIRTQLHSDLAAFSIPAFDGAFLNKPRVDALKTVEPVGEPFEEVRAAPIEVWEGEVKSVNFATRTMNVYLRSKLGHAPDHAGQIALEWVPSQDAELVRPGAVFYWTLYKETRRGSIKNSQELRFRRLPRWSRNQVDQIRALSSTLFKYPKEPRVLTENE